MYLQKVFEISKALLMNWIFNYKIVILNNDDENHPYKQVMAKPEKTTQLIINGKKL